MAITEGALIPAGARVRVTRASTPLDPALIGRTGTLVDASMYRAHSYGVVLDGEREVRMFAPGELKVVDAHAFPPDREQAKRWRALP